MASYTPNFNLKKPADSDSYDIADHNGNMDKIDTALNTLNSKIENQLGSLSVKFGVTLSGDVITTVNNASNGITFYYNSNTPTNRPSGGDYGSYIIFKATSTQARVMYMDGNGIFAVAGFDPSTVTSISWKKTTLS